MKIRTTNMILALVGPMFVLSHVLTKVEAADWIAQMLYWTAIFGLICACVNALAIEVMDIVNDVVDFVFTNVSEMKEKFSKK